MADYVKASELHEELSKSLVAGELTPKAIQFCMKINTEIHYKKLRYKDPADREDCMAGAMLDIILYWKNFKPLINGVKTNAFAYVTTILKNGSGKMYKKIHPASSKLKISIENIHTLA